ncbi:hypothetical protein D4R86_05735 [bacterium]|nr:MAG: hypothetical protein D4R86_05735 [bacterium]
MVQISGTNARYLQTPTILSEILRVAEPTLKFMEMIPFVDSGGLPITYGKKSSASSDAKKQTPRMTTPSSPFPEVQITRMTKETAITSTEGLSVKFDKSALELPAGRDMIMDAFESVGFWIAEKMNTNIYSALDSGSTDAGMTPAAAWSSSDATPLVDLMNFKNGMIKEGYPYRMTDIFIESTNYSELEGFLIGSEIPQYRESVLNAPIQDEIVLPLEGKPVIHRLLSGITHGDIMGLDRKNKSAASLFYHNDPKFGTPKMISYETTEKGKFAKKSVPNFGLSTHQYFDDATHDTIVQVWLDTVIKVKDEYGIITDSGL